MSLLRLPFRQRGNTSFMMSYSAQGIIKLVLEWHRFSDSNRGSEVLETCRATRAKPISLAGAGRFPPRLFQNLSSTMSKNTARRLDKRKPRQLARTGVFKPCMEGRLSSQYHLRAEDPSDQTDWSHHGVRNREATASSRSTTFDHMSVSSESSCFTSRPHRARKGSFKSDAKDRDRFSECQA